MSLQYETSSIGRDYFAKTYFMVFLQILKKIIKESNDLKFQNKWFTSYEVRNIFAKTYCFVFLPFLENSNSDKIYIYLHVIISMHITNKPFYILEFRKIHQTTLIYNDWTSLITNSSILYHRLNVSMRNGHFPKLSK